jgi:hypothetical protein
MLFANIRGANAWANCLGKLDDDRRRFDGLFAAWLRQSNFSLDRRHPAAY